MGDAIVDVIENEKEKILVLGYKDEVIDKCTNLEDIIGYIMDPELKEERDDCLMHRLFSH